MTETEKNELRAAFERMLEKEEGFAQVNTLSIVQEGLGYIATRRKNWTIQIACTEEFYS